MSLRKSAASIAAALMVGVFAFAGTALADTYNASSTSYAYMGGDFNTTETNYFIAGPQSYDFGGTNMWGFSTIKFSDIGTDEVGSAYLNLELLGVGSMNYEAASEEYPAVLDIYLPGNTDVASLTSDTISDMHDYLAESTVSVSITMTSNGVWAIDITDIYNAWASGDIENNGLVLLCASPNKNAAGGTIGAVGAVFSGLTGVGKSANGLMAGTTAPFIETSSVPVPGTLLLLGSGLVGLLGLGRRS